MRVRALGFSNANTFRPGPRYDGTVRSRCLVFSTDDCGYLRDSLCSSGGCEAGELETRHFPDGERYLRILTDSVRRDVVVLGGTANDADSHPRAHELAGSPGLDVVSTADLLADFLAE